MSELIKSLTPKWENDEVVWARLTQTNQGGGGYFYVSIRTSDSIIGNLQNKTAKELVDSGKFVD